MAYQFAFHLGDFDLGSGCKFQIIIPVFLFYLKNF